VQPLLRDGKGRLGTRLCCAQHYVTPAWNPHRELDLVLGSLCSSREVVKGYPVSIVATGDGGALYANLFVTGGRGRPSLRYREDVRDYDLLVDGRSEGLSTGQARRHEFLHAGVSCASR